MLHFMSDFVSVVVFLVDVIVETKTKVNLNGLRMKRLLSLMIK